MLIFYLFKGETMGDMVICGFCGRTFPRKRAIITYRGFVANDPFLKTVIGKDKITIGLSQKVYVCPKCARFHGIRGRRAED